MRVWMTVRWILTPIVALVAVIAAEVVVGQIFNVLFGSWPIVIAHPEVMQGFSAAFAAACMGTAAWCMAPFARRAVITVTFVAGVCMAWMLLEPWWYPESHPKAYQPSHVPLIITIMGGLIAYAVLWSVTPRWPGRRDAAAPDELTRPTGAGHAP